MIFLTFTRNLLTIEGSTPGHNGLQDMTFQFFTMGDRQIDGTFQSISTQYLCLRGSLSQIKISPARRRNREMKEDEKFFFGSRLSLASMRAPTERLLFFAAAYERLAPRDVSFSVLFSGDKTLVV